MAKQLGIENICVEMDADFLVYLILNPFVVYQMLEPLLNDCKNLIKTFSYSLLVHVYREANSYADRLARMGAELTSDFLILYNPPDVVVDLLA